jgi:hypothetical protein
LYGHETSSLKAREEVILRLSENRMLSRILGQKREENIGGWRS